MQVFLAGTPVHIATVFTDLHGNALDVTTALYRVLSHKGEELQPEQELVLPAESLQIPAELNQIAALDLEGIEGDDMDAITVRELRTVEFKLTLSSGNVIARKEVYALEPSDVLIIGLNSFQGYSDAELTALDIPNLDGWGAATQAERIAAMVEARLRITRLKFRDATRGQSYLREEIIVGDLSLVTPREFRNLTERLRAALRKAQVAEANSLLGGDPEGERRRSGLTQETVGESSQTWRNGKPLDLPVSRQALGYLSGFVSMNFSIGRA